LRSIAREQEFPTCICKVPNPGVRTGMLNRNTPDSYLDDESIDKEILESELVLKP